MARNTKKLHGTELRQVAKKVGVSKRYLLKHLRNDVSYPV